jgi:hypothetical protein
MFKNFVSLVCIVYSVIFAANEDDIAFWRQAEMAIRSQNVELIKENAELRGRTAPQEFFISQSKKIDGESDTDFKNRLLIPVLLCRVGWEGALFLMASDTILQEFFDGPNVPLCLKRKEVSNCVTKCFVSLEEASKKGQLGAVLYFLSPLNIVGRFWQKDFANGFLQHCQKNGCSKFAHYVLHHSDLFLMVQEEYENKFKIGKQNALLLRL